MPLVNESPRQAFHLPGEQLKKNYSPRTMVLFGLLLAMLLLGMANLYSASYGLSSFKAQLRNLAVIMPVFLYFCFFMPVKRISSLAWWAYFATLAALLVVLILGKVAGGAQRWINFGPIGFQPSEIAKLTVAIITARFFSAQRIVHPYQIRELAPLLLTVGLIFTLIFLQPDFGTAGMCAIIFVCQLCFIRIRLKSLLYAGLMTPVVGFLGWNLALKQYQKMRILNLFNPDLDPQNTGYNSLQSLIAIGSGGLNGKGFLQGTQAQLKFLPERHTDFVFAVFAEEQGFWGGTVVFFMFLALAYLALEIARHARDTFSALLAVGIAAFIFFEFVINIAMVLGMFPVVGLPLPFFSYGSSNLMTVCICMGILVAIERESVAENKRPGR